MAEYTEAELEKARHIKRLLRPEEPSAFGLKWAVKSKTATLESITECYEYLRDTGISQHKIALHTELLAFGIAKLQTNYEFLHNEMHLTPEKIAIYAQLLGMNPETIRSNGLFLRDEMHLTPEKIAIYAQLLGRNPAALKERLKALLRDGVDERRVLKDPALLAMKRDTALKRVKTA